jgi:hypothetical protein
LSWGLWGVGGLDTRGLGAEVWWEKALCFIDMNERKQDSGFPIRCDSLVAHAAVVDIRRRNAYTKLPSI